MKDSLINSITKIISYIKAFAAQTESEIKFEGNKSAIIKIMYNSLLEERNKERALLQANLDTVKNERSKVKKQIEDIKNKNEYYEKRTKALTDFQYFLLDMSDRRM
jgi:competence transcription factor ComK